MVKSHAQPVPTDLTGRTARQRRRALIASAVGTSIEWYDYFLYGTAAALVFPHVFFSSASPTAGILASFATFAVGFVVRPVGSALFGHYGDRIGRKATLILTLGLMGLASAAIGVLPSFASVGVVAPILLVVLRICQGIAVGGEWSGSVLIAIEGTDQRRRGLFGSIPQLGVPVGLLLGNGVMLSVTATMPDEAFLQWGWRVPFLVSLVLLAVGLYVRLTVLETPTFERMIRDGRVERRPVMSVLRKHWREVALTALVRMADQAPFYVFTAFILTYGEQELGMSRTLLLAAVMAAACLEFVTIPLFGALSDRLGRRRVYVVGAVLTGVIAIPYFAALDAKIAALAFAVIALSLVPHDLLYAPQAALIAETFTGRLRYSGAGLGYQLASIVAGGPAPLIAAALLASPFGKWGIAAYLMGCAVVTVVAVLLLPDRSRADITVEYDELQTPSRDTV